MKFLFAMFFMIGCGDINIDPKDFKESKDKTATEETSIADVGEPHRDPEVTAEARKPKNKKTEVVTKTSVEVNTEVNVNVENSDEELEFVDLEDGCSDWMVEGDFSVAIATDAEGFDFYGYMGAGSCDHIKMTFDQNDPKTTVTGSICSNNMDSVVTHKKDLRNLKALRFRREGGYIYYDILAGGRWIQTQFLSVQDDFKTPVTFCKYKKGQ